MNRFSFRMTLLSLGLTLAACTLLYQTPCAQERQERQDASVLPLDQALKRANVSGRYSMLLRQIKIEEDRLDFGSFNEFGYRTVTTCADYTDLPRGHWVYVYPYWYIWRDRDAGQRSSQEKRAWGPEQAAGPPDTPEAGDHGTAWASSTQDGSDEWLLVEFPKPVRATAAHIYETYNPGAIVRITVFALDGREVEVWRRPRPVIPSLPGYISKPGFSTKVLTNRIKIYLDSRSVPGWNEIDAVGIRGEDGGFQWASSVHASSTYGMVEERTDPREERIWQLEDEVRRLKAELEALKNRPKPEPPIR